MNLLLILAHPQPGSFNHAIAQAVRETLAGAGHRVVFRDLHAERFDPVIPPGESARAAALPPEVAAHCADLAAADGIVVVHPNWWGQPPAILKGWIDRVVRPGVAYEFREGDTGEGVPRGLLKARTAVVFNTSNTAAERERTVFGDPLETLWRNCIFGLCGVAEFHRRTFGVVATSTVAQRSQWLADAQALVDRAFGP
ncbi:MAG: NAD(P)H-dependent oxidoreductase [Kiritimatiellia bacterium]